MSQLGKKSCHNRKKVEWTRRGEGLWESRGEELIQCERVLPGQLDPGEGSKQAQGEGDRKEMESNREKDGDPRDLDV